MMILSDNSIRLKFYNLEYLPKYELYNMCKLTDILPQSIINISGFIKSKSFYIIDEDLMFNTVSVLIDNDDSILLGKLPDNDMLREAIERYVKFYIVGLVTDLNKFRDTVYKSMKRRNIRVYIDLTKMIMVIFNPKINKTEKVIDISKVAYRSSKESYELYVNTLSRKP